MCKRTYLIYFLKRLFYTKSKDMIKLVMNVSGLFFLNSFGKMPAFGITGSKVDSISRGSDSVLVWVIMLCS